LRHLEVWETTIGEAEVSLISEQSENLLELKLRQCNFNSHALDNLQGDTRRLFRDVNTCLRAFCWLLSLFLSMLPVHIFQVSAYPQQTDFLVKLNCELVYSLGGK